MKLNTINQDFLMKVWLKSVRMVGQVFNAFGLVRFYFPLVKVAALHWKIINPLFFQLVVLENTLKEIYVVLLFHFNMSLIVIQIQLQSNLPNDLLFESEHLVFKTKDL